LSIKVEVEDFKKTLDNAARVDWAQEKNKKRASMLPTATFKIPSLWVKQKKESEKQEERCIQQASEMSKTAKAEFDGSADDVAIAEGTLQEVSRRSRSEAGSEAEVKQRISRIKKDAKEIENSMTSNGGKEAIARAEKVAEDMDTQIDEGADKVCADSNAKESTGLNHILNMVRTNRTLAPTLLIRGSSMQVGSAVVATEEVVDLRNLEIGQFLATSVSIGSSMGGFGIGGYIGIADKGYKEDWTLEESYQTGLGVTTSFYGAAVSIITDADNSYTEWPFPFWKPDPLGVNTLAIGLSVSSPVIDAAASAIGAAGTAATVATGAVAGAVVLHNPGLLQTNATESAHLPVDVAATKAFMISSECYESMTELKEYMHYPWKIKHAQSNRDRRLITGYRVLSRLGLIAGGATNGAMWGSSGGPFGTAAGALVGTLATIVLPEVIFGALASLYDKYYGATTAKGQGYTRRCSLGSTNYRSNTTNFLRQLDHLLIDLADNVVELDRSAAKIRWLLETTKPGHSPEFLKFMQSISNCKDAPEGLFDQDAHYQELGELSIEQLKSTCASQGFKNCEGLRRRQDLQDKLVLWEDLQDDQFSLEELQLLKGVMERTAAKVVEEAATSSDKDCKWDYPKKRCKNPEACSYQYKALDLTLDQSCRLIPSEHGTKGTLDTGPISAAIEECKRKIDEHEIKDASNCLVGKKLYRKLSQDLDGKHKQLHTMCDEMVEGACQKRGEAGLLYGEFDATDQTDKEMMLLIILKGSDAKAELKVLPDGEKMPVNAFGSCDEDTDCTKLAPNTECRRMKTGNSACRCKQNTCAMIEDGSSHATCRPEARMESLDEHELMTLVQHKILRMKVSIGQAALDLQKLATFEDQIGNGSTV